jgi:hypothetical protein
MQQWNKGLRLKRAAICEEGEDNRNGIRGRSMRQKQHLGSRITLGRIFRKTAELESQGK